MPSPRFKKGMPRPKGAGRQKGSQNKRTVFLSEALDKVSVNLSSEVKKVMPLLTPKERAEFLIRLMEFVYPKRTAVDMNITGDLKINSFTEAITDVNQMITKETIDVTPEPELKDESGTH